MSNRSLLLSVNLACVFAIAPVLSTPRAIAEEPAVSVVVEGTPGPAASHGLAKLTAALEGRGLRVERVAAPDAARGSLLVLAGLATRPGPAVDLFKTAGADLPEGPEALAVCHGRAGGKPALAVVGSDDRGLMYALLDVADRIGWAPDAKRPLSEVRNAAEKPFVPDRALSIYTMHRACFETRFYDEQYWARYLDMLAANRFNRFVLILGYENWGYFAPPYPFFFDVEGFPDVRVVGLTAEQQRKDLDALNRLVAMAHARGLEFTLGIWDHVYRGGVQGPRERAKEPTPGVVWGLTPEKLVPYTKVALAKLLREVPDLDAIQFRMHGESGLKRDEMEEFWVNIYQVMLDHGRGIRFDARAKNFPHALIDKALEMGVPIRICTKYWMEQMGLPFHPTHIHPANQLDRRHGYADLLRYPKQYDMHWRLWNAGTTRVLLWGDPEYVRRFALSTHLYQGQGFEVNEPMGTKMQDHPHDLPPFDLLRPQYRYYDWEFERYWHFFQVFGRLGYNPDTPPEVWQHEFRRRFGGETAPLVERAMHRASRVLPRIVAYSYPYKHFPTTRGWAERQRQEDLPQYAAALPSDTEQFLSIDDAARFTLEGKGSARKWPQQSAAWFARTAEEILALVGQAEEQAGLNKNKEFLSTMVDLKILAHLAEYHAWRARAGLHWALFKHSQDLNALDDAINCEGRAVRAWQAIVDSAADVYHDDLMMGRRGADLSGHWKDELVKLQEGLEKLRAVRRDFRPKTGGEGPAIAHVPVRTTPPGRELSIRATIAGRNPIAGVRLGYTRAGYKTRYIDMRQAGRYLVRAAIPAAEVAEGLRYFIEATDDAGQRTQWPGPVDASPVAVTVTEDTQPPAVVHVPVPGAAAGEALTVNAEVTDPSGLRWVRLRYRSVTQYEDYRTLEMHPTGSADQYRATVPAEHVVPQWDFMYFIEVMDHCGNGKIYPDLEKGAPYVVVPLRRGAGNLLPNKESLR